MEGAGRILGLGVPRCGSGVLGRELGSRQPFQGLELAGNLGCWAVFWDAGLCFGVQGRILGCRAGFWGARAGWAQRKASHHSRRQPEQSRLCLALAPHVSLSHSRNSSSSLRSTRNCPSTTYA